MKITHDNLVMCSDCTQMIANGELGQGDTAAEYEHHLKMVEQWGDDVINLVLGGPEGGVDFSTRRCNGCGSTLAGYRHPAVCFGTEGADR